MRQSRTRFSKRRSKRKTEFPIVAVVQKKVKPVYSVSKRSTGSNKETNRDILVSKISPAPTEKDFVNQKEGDGEDQKFTTSDREGEFVESAKKKTRALQRLEKRNPSRPPKKSRATIDYKNIILLRKLLTAEGKILPRRINKLTAKQQRYVQKAIKSARIMGLVPFINKSRPFS